MECHGIQRSPDYICPFSKLYLELSLYYSDYDSSDESSSSEDELTKEDIISLTKELKIRAQKLCNKRISSTGDLSKYCILEDLNIHMYGEEIREGEYNISNEFTKLLNKLLIKKRDIFNTKRGNISIESTELNILYSYLRELIRKPLTKEEIIFIVNGLENRNTNLSANINTAHTSYDYNVFKDLFHTYYGLITEVDTHLETYEFTRLLEDLIIEKQQLFQKKQYI